MTQVQTETSSVRVNNVHLVRWKKLKGGRKVIRTLRTIPIHALKHTFSGNQHVKRMAVDFDHKYGTGQMLGVVDKDKGQAKFDSKVFIPAGYLKGRGFELVGYDLIANITHLVRRATPMPLKATPAKGPTRRGMW